jgi:ATP-dependent RNA helicase SUPV3L1/SUV3
MDNLLEAEYKQFSLSKDGTIYFQSDKTNPMPGVALANIVKGSSLLAPQVQLITTELPKTINSDEVTNKVSLWLLEHISSDLEALVQLNDIENIDNEDVKNILTKLYQSYGVLSRSSVENYISNLGQEERRQLRNKKIRLGPVLIFLPTLNKPAAIHLKAILYNLWNDIDLPANVPADGIVSFAFEGAGFQKDFLEIIGYPVCGPRAIRVDMLDRLISMIYDSAEGGKFKAKHEMAELLGCSINDLYLVLEAIGHKKIHDPAETVNQSNKDSLAEDNTAQEKTENSTVESKDNEVKLSSTHDDDELKDTDNTSNVISTNLDKTESQENQETEIKDKPDLATFRLKGGKAYEKKDSSKLYSGKKNKSHKNKNKDYKNKHKKKNQGPRVISAKPENKKDDSPFAILKDLKVNSDEN